MRPNKKKLNPNETDTLVGEGSAIEGKLISKASLRIEGKVTGDIVCEGDVTIGEQGAAASNIMARNVYAAGSIQGSVTTNGVLEITSTGKVFGNIHVRSLSIAEGGVFQGMSRMADGNAETTARESVEEQPSFEENTVQLRKPHLHKVEKEAAN